MRHYTVFKPRLSLANINPEKQNIASCPTFESGILIKVICEGQFLNFHFTYSLYSLLPSSSSEVLMKYTSLNHLIPQHLKYKFSITDWVSVSIIVIQYKWRWKKGWKKAIEANTKTLTIPSELNYEWTWNLFEDGTAGDTISELFTWDKWNRGQL